MTAQQMTRNRIPPKTLILAAFASLILVLSGCSSSQVQSSPQVKIDYEAIDSQGQAEVDRASQSAQAEESAALAALYADLSARIQDFHSAFDLIHSGDAAIGQERLNDLQDWLKSAALECSQLAGCEIERFFGAYQHILNEQASTLTEQISRAEELEVLLEEDSERESQIIPYVEVAPEELAGVTLFRGKDLRELISLNTPVKAALDDWLTWMRPDLLLSAYNYQFLRPTMAPIYEEAGLPEALLFAILATETRGKVHSRSRAGAAGPLQFMRGTGRRFGLEEVDGFDLRYDPAAATRANVAYLNEQFRSFDNSLEKALAAYNGGESRMRGLNRRYDGASFWDRRIYYSFPRETRDYVPRVLAAAWLYLNPELYRLELPVVATQTVTLNIEREASVGELAVCLGQKGNPVGWFRTLRNLNPRLEPNDKVPAGGTLEVPTFVVPVYRERCLSGELVAAAAEMHLANYPPQPEMIPYTVRGGDSLGKIASRFSCTSLGEIAQVNRIRAPRYVIREGQRLMIPACD